MAGGEPMRAAVAAQPARRRQGPTDRRLPPGTVGHTGCGATSHGAQTGGSALRAPREGVYVAAEAYHTEEMLDGHLAAIDERVRCFVLEGEGRAAERAREAARALEELGCDAKLVPTTHPVVDVVRFQLLTIDLAEARGVNPDLIRRDDPRWERARAAYL